MNFSHRFGLMLLFCLAGGFLDLSAQEPSRQPAPATNSPASAPTLNESLLLQLLTAKLQTDVVKERGELELRLARPWQPLPLPAEPISIKILELPAAGVTPQFIARIEVLTPSRSLGVWQTVLQAKVWREISVARVPLIRGHLLDLADISLDRRDVLSLRSELASPGPEDVRLELTEAVPTGAPILTRALKVRPVVRRGQFAEALVSEGTMQITMKVEVLEDGAPGQTVRLRNFQSRREFRGIVQNENRIIIPL